MHKIESKILEEMYKDPILHKDEFCEPKMNGISHSSNFDTIKVNEGKKVGFISENEIKKLVEEADKQLSDEDILKQREAEYGSPSESFGAIAQMWSAYLGTTVSKQDVAMMMGLMKINRSKTSSGFHYYDSLQDCRNYMTLAEKMTKEDENGNSNTASKTSS